MKSEMTSKAGDDNPFFAALGAAMMNSFSIEPGVIMWILMVAAACGLALQLTNRGAVNEKE